MIKMRNRIAISAFLFSLQTLTTATPTPAPNALFTSPSDTTTGYISAIGIGITSLDATNKFYTSVFGFGKGARMSFSGWDEDIMTPLPGGGPTLIPMKFKTGGSSPITEDRPVKNLPVKLTFTVPNAKAVVDKVVKAGGTAVVDTKGRREGALYAKDLDGYLLELVPGDTMAFAGAAYGSSDPKKSATFFAKLAGTSPLPVTKAGAGNVVTVPTKKKFQISFLDFKDGRPTKKLPLKIVWSVPSIPGFKKTITDGGGSLIEKGLGVLGAVVGMGYDGVDQIMIEINFGVV
ncbi:hypothetical protein EG328_004163 [Venturia inaequalis]|uniref:VOC domain-containing protein n=1 Tax=Venturia inaequalis TaxID=5025 RepID=A0A8H3YU58_VENIN|nr:hypothetical protein EG328_004163 [Venturia inaequalis]